jgi:hypothetical protein
MPDMKRREFITAALRNTRFRAVRHGLTLVGQGRARALERAGAHPRRQPR